MLLADAFSPCSTMTVLTDRSECGSETWIFPALRWAGVHTSLDLLVSELLRATRPQYRSLGDTIAHSAGVSSEPEIFRETIDPGSMAFLVSLAVPHLLTSGTLTPACNFVQVGASDGLWEFLSDQDVVDMIAKGNGQDPKAMVTELITTANNEWLKEEEVMFIVWSGSKRAGAHSILHVA